MAILSTTVPDDEDLSSMQSAIPSSRNKNAHREIKPHALTPYFKSDRITLYHGDAATIMARLAGSLEVNCIVTSPPYYGQRDYRTEGQIGLEIHPKIYLEKLVTTFLNAYDLLAPGGSLWVVIGDTYWSGKGKPKGSDLKQKHRRFERPQDKTGLGPWCMPKQQLLIPHRFAIAMQDLGWIVRNDNVWAKPSPMPDPTEDRCALSHEFVFHFVKQRRYYFDMKAVAVSSTGSRGTKPPASVWTIPTARSKKHHPAVFPDELVALPIDATCPDDGILLDPFCGSGTALLAALARKPNCHVIGIDISESALQEAQRSFTSRMEK